MNFFNHDFLRQIQFVYNYKNLKDHIPFNLPEYAYIEFANVQPIMNKIHKILDYKFDLSMFKKYINENDKNNDIKKIIMQHTKNLQFYENFR